MIVFTNDSDGFVSFDVHFVFGDFFEFGFRNRQLLAEFDVFNLLIFQQF